MAKHSKERTEAEAQFKKTQKAQQATEGAKATSEYVAAGHAVRAKTARLRELRLAKEAADKKDKTKHTTVFARDRASHKEKWLNSAAF